MVDEHLLGRETFVARSEALFAQGLYQEALEMAESRLRNFPEDMNAKVVLCHALIGMDREQEAMRRLEEIEEAILGFSRIYASMGDLCRGKGMREEAVSYYRKFVALNPYSAITEEVKRHLHALLDETVAAEADENACEEKQSMAAGFQTVTMADLYIRQGFLDEAAGILEKILEKEPGHLQAFDMLAKVKAGMAVRGTGGKEPGADRLLLDELERWMKNIERIRAHVA